MILHNFDYKLFTIGLKNNCTVIEHSTMLAILIKTSTVYIYFLAPISKDPLPVA